MALGKSSEPSSYPLPHGMPTLGRKPAIAGEKAPPNTILVTGAAGYLGSRVTERLLALGHTVHALCLSKELQPGGSAEVLQSLPGADSRLQLLEGNVLEPDSLAAAVAKGAGVLVHLVAVVDTASPDPEAIKGMLRIAVEGTKNTLGAASGPGSQIKRVVLLSSIAAVYGDNYERGAGHTYTEEDWPLTSDLGKLTYSYCKTAQERAAVEVAEKADWTLARLNPGVVWGPVPSQAAVFTSPGVIFKMITGVAKRSADVWLPVADVDDVAAAVAVLVAQPDKIGRYIICNATKSMVDVNAELRATYPDLPVPSARISFWLLFLICYFFPYHLNMNWRMLRSIHGKPLHIDASKATKELGLTYMEFSKTLKDTVDSFKALNMCK